MNVIDGKQNVLLPIFCPYGTWRSWFAVKYIGGLCRLAYVALNGRGRIYANDSG